MANDRTSAVLSNPVLRQLFDDGRPIDAERFRDLLICVDGIGCCMKSLVEQMRTMQEQYSRLNSQIASVAQQINSVQGRNEQAQGKMLKQLAEMEGRLDIESTLVDLTDAIDGLTKHLQPKPKWWKWW